MDGYRCTFPGCLEGGFLSQEELKKHSATHQEKEENEATLKKQAQENPYRVLGLDKSATQEEIRAKYKKLSMTYHPDKGGSTEMKLSGKTSIFERSFPDF